MTADDSLVIIHIFNSRLKKGGPHTLQSRDGLPYRTDAPQQDIETVQIIFQTQCAAEPS